MDLKNCAIITGFIGKDAKVGDYSYTDKKTKEKKSGKFVELKIATNHGTSTEWHTAVGYGDHFVEYLGHLTKGDKVQVSGYLKYEPAEKNDVKFHYTKIIIQHFELAQSKTSENSEKEAA